MDADRFDRLTQHLTRRLFASGTRRGLLRLAAAGPAAGAVLARLAAAGQGQGNGAAVGGGGRRRRKRRHDPGGDKENRKGKRKDKRKRPRTAARPCRGLRPADDLHAAVAAAAPGATLTLCPGTWVLTDTVDIDKNLTVRGAGAGRTVLDGGRQPDGTGGVRVVQIASGPSVTLQALTITNGAVDQGGGIRNFGTLTLVGVTVTGNTAEIGGGIINVNIGLVGATLTLGNGSRVTGNTATRDGGGIYSQSSTLTLQDGSRVTGNAATRFGGGIVSFGSRSTATVDAGALVCDNTPAGDQCAGGGYTGPCPNPPNGVCPA